MKLIKDEGAAKVGNFLVISDLHLGYEKQLKEKGFSVPSQTKSFVEKIKEIEGDFENLLLLGDVKHNIPKISYQERKEIPYFFSELDKEFGSIVVVKGNHDGNIEKLTRGNAKVVSDYTIGREYGFSHGHRWPSEEVMKCETLFIGHVHPSFRVKDESGARYNYRSWMVSKLDREKIIENEKYEEVNCEKVIVMPVFNPFFQGREDLTGPLSNYLTKKEIMLLDLTKVK